MQPRPLDDQCSRHFTWRALIECGNTQAVAAIANFPKKDGSWKALQALSDNILDPVVDEFGPIDLTFGFCSPELYKAIPRGTSAKHDQHHAHEVNTRDNIICDRLGAAVDFKSETAGSHQIASWIVTNLDYDRLYFYGDERPLHVSYGPDHTRQIVVMRQSTKLPDRKIPSVTSLEKFLNLNMCARETICGAFRAWLVFIKLVHNARVVRVERASIVDGFDLGRQVYPRIGGGAGQ